MNNNYVQDHHFCLNTFDEQLSFKCKPLKKRCEFLACKIRLQDMNVSHKDIYRRSTLKIHIVHFYNMKFCIEYQSFLNIIEI